MPQDFIKIVKTIDDNTRDESHGAMNHWLIKIISGRFFMKILDRLKIKKY